MYSGGFEGRQIPQLTDRLQWDLVTRQTFIGQEVISGPRRRISYFIPTQRILITGNVLIIGVGNPIAPPSWYVGGWATQSLIFDPSSTSIFATSGVKADRKTLRINALNLWIVPRLDVPWTLEISFPYWHRQIDLEVWIYSGADFSAFDRFNDLDVQLIQFADAIDGGV